MRISSTPVISEALSFADQCLRGAAVCGCASCTACQCYFHVDAVKPSCSDFRRTRWGENGGKRKRKAHYAVPGFGCALRSLLVAVRMSTLLFWRVLTSKWFRFCVRNVAWTTNELAIRSDRMNPTTTLHQMDTASQDG